MRLRIKIDDRAVRAAMDALAERMSDAETMFAEIGEYLQKSHDDRFQAQEAANGTPWEPLSPRYRARKRRNTDKILQLDGNLRDLTYKPSRDSLEFGTARIYGATHQFGDEDRGIPARPFLGLSADDEAEIMEIVQAHLRDALEG